MITIIFYLLFPVITLFVSISCIIFSFFDPKRKIVHGVFVRFWGKSAIFLSGSKVKIIGEENLIHDRGVVYASNHQGNFDIFLLNGYLKTLFSWISKEVYFRVPILGWAMKRTGYISIDRENPRDAMKSINLAVDKIKSGTSVVIFPEGTRSLDGEIHEFKRGSLLIATKSNAPIIPITIVGSYNVKRKGSVKINPSHIKLIIDKPIETKDMSKSEQKEVLERTRTIIMENFKRYAK